MEADTSVQLSSSNVTTCKYCFCHSFLCIPTACTQSLPLPRPTHRHRWRPIRQSGTPEGYPGIDTNRLNITESLKCGQYILKKFRTHYITKC
jgi:hypothetical protein